MMFKAVLLLVAAASSVGAFAPATTPVPMRMPTKIAPMMSQHPSHSKMARSMSTSSLSMSSSTSSSPDEGAGAGGGAVGGGSATMMNEIFNLIKGIVGAGVLSLPAGIAAFGNAPSAIVPAVGLIAVIGFFSGYGFSLIGRVCSYTGGTSYREAWSGSVGDGTSWIPTTTCTIKTCMAILMFSMILADTVQALLAGGGILVSRTASLLGVTSFALLPLCLMKNLSSLAPFSLVGTVGMLYTAVAMGLRYFRGSYGLELVTPGATNLLADVATNLRPAFGTRGAKAVVGPEAAILVSMLSTAYMAHFNAPKFFVELKDNTVKRFNTVVGTSFGVSALIMSVIASLGYLTFGSNCSGLILNNYSNKDALMGFSRVAVALSLVFSYPLAFVGARDGWLDLLKIPQEKRTNATLNKATLIILAGITFMATQLKELAFIMSFAGATLGNALIYVYPALMFRAAVKNMGEKASKGLKREVPFAMFSAAFGAAMGCVGAKMALGML